jgi:hypothetical protein
MRRSLKNPSRTSFSFSSSLCEVRICSQRCQGVGKLSAYANLPRHNCIHHLKEHVKLVVADPCIRSIGDVMAKRELDAALTVYC